MIPFPRSGLDARKAQAALPFGDSTYYFCSFDCARTFAQRPNDYAGA